MHVPRAWMGGQAYISEDKHKWYVKRKRSLKNGDESTDYVCAFKSARKCPARLKRKWRQDLGYFAEKKRGDPHTHDPLILTQTGRCRQAEMQRVDPGVALRKDLEKDLREFQSRLKEIVNKSKEVQVKYRRNLYGYRSLEFLDRYGSASANALEAARTLNEAVKTLDDKAKTLDDKAKDLLTSVAPGSGAPRSRAGARVSSADLVSMPPSMPI